MIKSDDEFCEKRRLYEQMCYDDVDKEERAPLLKELIQYSKYHRKAMSLKYK